MQQEITEGHVLNQKRIIEAKNRELRILKNGLNNIEIQIEQKKSEIEDSETGLKNLKEMIKNQQELVKKRQEELKGEKDAKKKGDKS